mmetsp:Transcript_58296/g.151864  ORF Transcript_58296/g.151864 Transcript_58296/m.151864 type:complete len:352 (+) Transcript_58296:101-1156(+)
MGTSAIEYTFADVQKKLGHGGTFVTGCCSVVVAILIILFGPAAVAQLGQKQYGLVRNKMTGVVNLDTSYEPGRYWIGFWSEFLEFPSTLNTIEFSDEVPEEGVQHLSYLNSRDMDGKPVYMDVSIQYKLKQESLGTLYYEFQNTYEDVYISALRDALSKVGNNFKISRMWEDYRAVNKLMKDACDLVLAERHAYCWDLQLWRVRLEDRYEDALVRTQVQKQAQITEEARKQNAAVRARTQVILAEYTKNKTVIESTGEAQVYELERAAKANAEEAIVNIQADILKEVKGILKFNSSDIMMNEQELVEYQKLVMLHSHTSAHFVYHTEGGKVEARNVQATRAITDMRRLREL